MMLAANPVVGDEYAGSHADGQDVMVVLSLDEIVTVPAGSFDHCMKVQENPDDPEDADLIIYAPGVGLTSEQSTSGRIELISIN